MPLPLIPILLVGGVALMAVAGRKKGGGGGWRSSGIPGLQVKGADGTCTEVRIGNVPQFENWAETDPAYTQLEEVWMESLDAAMVLFFEELGCPANYDMLVHRVDGTIWTIREYMEMMAGASMGPGASFLGTLGL